jgi:cell division septal protein FtsQ
VIRRRRRASAPRLQRLRGALRLPRLRVPRVRVPLPRLPRLPRPLRLALGPALVVLVAGGVVAAAVAAPAALRRTAAYPVLEVRVEGTLFLEPADAVAAAGIAPGASVFSDPEPWRAALEAHPLVAAAAIRRELPATVVLSIREAVPVALLPTPELRPVDAGGTVLPLALHGAPLDLPVLFPAQVAASGGRVVDAGALAMLATYETVRRRAPELAALISEMHPAQGGGYRLVLRDAPWAEALIPEAAGGAERDDASADAYLRQLRLALRDLAARRELEQVRRVDARFRDQVVVTLDPRKKTS